MLLSIAERETIQAAFKTTVLRYPKPEAVAYHEQGISCSRKWKNLLLSPVSADKGIQKGGTVGVKLDKGIDPNVAILAVIPLNEGVYRAYYWQPQDPGDHWKQYNARNRSYAGHFREAKVHWQELSEQLTTMMVGPEIYWKAYQMNHRGGEISSYRLVSFNETEKKALMVCQKTYPSEFDRVIISALLQKYSPTSSDKQSVHLDANKISRTKGSHSCTYKLFWWSIISIVESRYVPVPGFWLRHIDKLRLKGACFGLSRL